MAKASKTGKAGLKFSVRVGKKQKTFESVKAAAKFFGLPYDVLYQRLFVMEWSPAKAVTTPLRKFKRKAKKAKSKKRK